MLVINPKETNQREVQKWMNGGVAPRPIAFVSTLSKDGIRNLSPFSFYNVFGTNPPVVAFSPSRRGRDNTTKDTYENIVATGECVVNAVTYEMKEQMNLASGEYEHLDDEFVISGFTPVESQFVKPPRVAESPFQMECKLMQMVNLGGMAGSGNLAICEVVMIYIDESIISDGKIDPYLMNHIGRNGGNWYTRAFEGSMFELAKPVHADAIGFENLPEYVKQSQVLSANDLGMLISINNLPSMESARQFGEDMEPLKGNESSFLRYTQAGNFIMATQIAKYLSEMNPDKARFYFDNAAKSALNNRDINTAWKILIYSNL